MYEIIESMKSKKTNTPSNAFDSYSIAYYKDIAHAGKEVGEFVTTHHYLHTLCRGTSVCAVLRIDSIIHGVALFGIPVGINVKQCYSPDKPLLELKRFVLHDTPTNTASWFMARCIRHIHSTTNIANIISYADPSAGHEGIIYRASNFAYLGKQKYSPGYVFTIGRRSIHQRNAYQKGTATYDLVQAARAAGKLKKKVLKPKHIYLYQIN